MLGAGHVTGVDLDPSALDTAQTNLDEFDIDNVDLVNLDVRKVGNVLREKVEVVLMNPPFGTKHNKGQLKHLVTILVNGHGEGSKSNLL